MAALASSAGFETRTAIGACAIAGRSCRPYMVQGTYRRPAPGRFSGSRTSHSAALSLHRARVHGSLRSNDFMPVHRPPRLNVFRRGVRRKELNSASPRDGEPPQAPVRLVDDVLTRRTWLRRNGADPGAPSSCLPRRVCACVLNRRTARCATLADSLCAQVPHGWNLVADEPSTRSRVRPCEIG